MDLKIARKNTIKLLGEEGLSGIRIEAPNATEAFIRITREIIPERYVQKRVLDQLKRQKMIDVRSARQTYTLCITPKAAHKLLMGPIDELTITAMQPWDKQWRMVTFDIPKGKNSERLFFYRKLKILGFTLADKSMWLHPYECHSEIALLADYLNISKYVQIHTISELDSKTLRKLSIPSS